MRTITVLDDIVPFFMQIILENENPQKVYQAWFQQVSEPN